MTHQTSDLTGGTHLQRRSLRLSIRALAVVAFVAVSALTPAAMADTPQAWDDAPEHSGFAYLLVLFLIPAGLALVITLLAVLPSVVRGESHEAGDSWRADDEWFGGPRRGLEAKDSDRVGADKGGASGQW